MRDDYHAKVKRVQADHDYKQRKMEEAMRSKLGGRCPEGHLIVGYRGQNSGLPRAYCQRQEGFRDLHTPEGIEKIPRVQIHFLDHSAEPFWVDRKKVIFE